jgi:N utilization substance protein B
MGKRRDAREAVLESLYGWEMRVDTDIRELFEINRIAHRLDKDNADFAFRLLTKTIENVENLDAEIAKFIENWDLGRLAIIDKNILRLSLAELYFFPEIPRKVTIDEAIELAKTFGAADSGRFVNGVLDAISKKQSDPSLE